MLSGRVCLVVSERFEVDGWIGGLSESKRRDAGEVR